MNALKRPSLLRNLQIGFGLSLLILVITSIASFSSIQRLLEGSRWVDHTDSVIVKLERTLSTIKDAETGQRGFLLTNDTSFLTPYYGAREKALIIVDSILVMTADNPEQQQSGAELRNILAMRLTVLQQSIDQKRSDNIFNVADLRKGKEFMDQTREIIQKMQEEEHRLLVIRLANVKQFSAYTPVLIIVAAILSILITVFFYRRVYNDYLERAALYAELQKKDGEITRRIDIIQGIADKISAGNYQTRVTDEEKDGLGSLAGSLNKMAQSLEYSFDLLSDKEWMQTGIATLNSEMVGQLDMRTMAAGIIQFVAGYSHSLLGALYVLDPADHSLALAGSYALAHGGSREVIREGEGLAGQCALEGRTKLVTDIGAGKWVLNFAAGAVAPRNMIAFPFFHEKKVKGVIELGSLESWSEREQEFFNNIGSDIGSAVNGMQNREKLQELLEETQTQTEELQSQHTEMENLNSELEMQAEKLQVSEEELKVQQEELQQTNQELEERSRMLEEKNHLVTVRNLDIQKKAEELALVTRYKSEFMANMSHELRTPLNSILLLSRLLAENTEKNLSGEQIEYAKVIQNSGNGLLELIDEILDLSRIESGKLPLEHMIVPMSEIMEDMRMLFAPLAKDKGLQLNIIAEEGAPKQLETDKMRLEQILKNLLSNAFKFTPHGHITLRISASATRRNSIDFSVQDSGIGIPEEKHALIFEAFQQADGSTRRKYGGTGLGLSISQQLAKLLGGEITLSSTPGEGSEFRASIPEFKTSPPGEEPVLLPEKEPAPVQRSPAYTLPDIPAAIPDDRDRLTEADKVLLIVEDDTRFAKALLDFSRQKGYKGIVVVRGDEAIDMAKKYSPLGILLDIQLPVKSGWEVMEELKKDPQTRHIPVHIMSSIEAKKESLLKGAVDFVSKPLAFENMDSIFKKIEHALNKSPKKVLIVEDNARHAQALAYFLATHNVHSEVSGTVGDGISALKRKEVDCVILNLGDLDGKGYELLDPIKQSPDLENIPVIVFTGKSISKGEELRLKQYADSIVVKTAHSYQRILDEVSIFLHLVDEGREKSSARAFGKLGALDEVLKNKTVLVADDDVRNIYSLTRALETHKMKVLSAMDGKEALAALEESQAPADIILMDMMMPEMDGYEAIERIRRNPRLKHIPVIAVTAKAMAGDREKCMRAGASDYISKPIDSDQLVSLLRIWLYDK
ncbi:MAG TPA: response regulator [Puia sp.]|nr:response regulator [Puia sp.]